MKPDALVEKVARALCQENFRREGAESEFGSVDDCWWAWCDEARAAVEAAGVAELREENERLRRRCDRYRERVALERSIQRHMSANDGTFFAAKERARAALNQGKAQADG